MRRNARWTLRTAGSRAGRREPAMKADILITDLAESFTRHVVRVRVKLRRAWSGGPAPCVCRVVCGVVCGGFACFCVQFKSSHTLEDSAATASPSPSAVSRSGEIVKSCAPPVTVMMTSGGRIAQLRQWGRRVQRPIVQRAQPSHSCVWGESDEGSAPRSSILHMAWLFGGVLHGMGAGANRRCRTAWARVRIGGVPH